MKRFAIIILLSIVISGCAVQQITTPISPVGVTVPPGIDSLTTAIADSIFSQVAVTNLDARRADEYFKEAKLVEGLIDSLWLAGEQGVVTAQDSLRIQRQWTEADGYLQSDRANYKQIKKLKKKLGIYNTQFLARVSRDLMAPAIDLFETSIKINRFSILHRQAFSKFLQKVAARKRDASYLVRAADELERVVFVIKELHQLYYELGDIYFKLKQWNKAFDNYARATEVLRKSAIFSLADPTSYFDRIAEVPVDTNRLVGYLNKQALCKTKLYQAQPALALYREAKAVTPNPDLKEIFERRIKWILWDDGNIRASEMKDKADTLRFVEKNFAAAKDQYLQLLDILWTKRTKDEINWNIAQLDFQQLGKKAAGVARMFYVIKNSAVDSLTGAPIDSSYFRYFNTYGKMCFNLGNEFLQKDKLTAYIYFQQAALTNYEEQGKAYLRIAQLSQFNPVETIDLCQKTMDYVDELSNVEKSVLYEVLYRAYRKLGDFKNAMKWYQRYKSL